MPPPNYYDEPALGAPKGVVPYVTNSSDEQFWYYVYASFCTTISGIFLPLRLYIKLRIIRKVELIDCAIRPLPSLLVLTLF